MSRKKSRNLIFLIVPGIAAGCSFQPEPSVANMPEPGTADAVLFKERCHDCHQPPNPSSHEAGAWPSIVQRMQSHRIANGMMPLTGEEIRRISAYLQRNSKESS